jgi:hypothetical protein
MTAKGKRPSKSSKPKKAGRARSGDKAADKKHGKRAGKAKGHKANGQNAKGQKAKGQKAKGQKAKKSKAPAPPKHAGPEAARVDREGADDLAVDEAGASLSSADIWLNPASASGFATLAWLSQAATVRPLRLTIHLVSESISEDGLEVSEERRRWLDSAWAPVRVAHAVQRNYGQEQLHSFLIAFGMRVQVLGEPLAWEAIEGALTAVGLPPEMAQLGFTGDNDDDLRRAHFEAVAVSGEPAPTTALLLDGVGWTAPEWQQVPSGEPAGVALDAIGDLGRVSGLISLRRRPLG